MPPWLLLPKRRRGFDLELVPAPDRSDWHNRERIKRLWLALFDLQERNFARATPNAFRFADCPVALDLSFEIWFRGGKKQRK